MSIKSKIQAVNLPICWSYGRIGNRPLLDRYLQTRSLRINATPASIEMGHNRPNAYAISLVVPKNYSGHCQTGQNRVGAVVISGRQPNQTPRLESNIAQELCVFALMRGRRM
jgi:hypothetical protein